MERLAEAVSHCMLEGESEPPQARGTMWSTWYPGQGPEVSPVLGQGLEEWKAARLDGFLLVGSEEESVAQSQSPEAASRGSL